MIRSSVVKTRASAMTTLRFDPKLCIDCRMCIAVCPHSVFASNCCGVELVRPEACMECGACQRNCPTGAVTVESGVGCASAMIYAALTGKAEPTCGGEFSPCCGGEAESSCCSDDSDLSCCVSKAESSCCGGGGHSSCGCG
jgi:NAD-dependent dihydropyrimidine dehydrogenase PreA subunit